MTNFYETDPKVLAAMAKEKEATAEGDSEVVESGGGGSDRGKKRNNNKATTKNNNVVVSKIATTIPKEKKDKKETKEKKEKAEEEEDEAEEDSDADDEDDPHNEDEDDDEEEDEEEEEEDEESDQQRKSRKRQRVGERDGSKAKSVQHTKPSKKQVVEVVSVNGKKTKPAKKHDNGPLARKKVPTKREAMRSILRQLILDKPDVAPGEKLTGILFKHVNQKCKDLSPPGKEYGYGAQWFAQWIQEEGIKAPAGDPLSELIHYKIGRSGDGKRDLQFIKKTSGESTSTAAGTKRPRNSMLQNKKNKKNHTSKMMMEEGVAIFNKLVGQQLKSWDHTMQLCHDVENLRRLLHNDANRFVKALRKMAPGAEDSSSSSSSSSAGESIALPTPVEVPTIAAPAPMEEGSSSSSSAAVAI